MSDILLRNLNLSWRTIHALAGNGVHTLDSLVRIKRWNVERMWGVGKRAVSELDEYLARHNLNFARRIDFEHTCPECGTRPCPPQYWGPGVSEMVIDDPELEPELQKAWGRDDE